MANDRQNEQKAMDGGREGPGDGMGAGEGGDQVWRYQVPPPGHGAEAGAGAGAGTGESNAGHYTPNAAGRGGGIVSAPAESNVNPPGQPMSGAGSATDPAPGTISGIQASREAAAKGGVEGMPDDMASNADGNMSGSAGTDRN
ncbi:hypothetical protein [Massilia sp. MS-15]|uniref:hypothetical protein n=1 Tax=Massilia sp. MS-15 TaxID=2878200 RepID=UPI001CD3AE70|nr:hypothetical protein [Massilia sp. MS-15]MCA1246598.1 hypothetical protein [Massilia sp. MS-15]